MHAECDTELTINSAAVGRNFQLLQGILGATECRAVIKADAYGLGAVQLAPALAAAGCRHFYVATLEEAAQLRQVLPHALIYILHGLLPGQEALIHQLQAVPVLNDFYQIELWRRYAALLEKQLPAALHIDTGLTRLGIEFSAYPQLLADKSQLSGLVIDHVMTHLSCSRDPTHPMNHEQLLMGSQLHAMWPGMPFSFSSSGGMFIGPEYYFDIVRAGCSLYGIAPTSKHKHVMEPVITLTSRLLQVRNISKHAPVGYGCAHTAKPGDKIAVAALGYADGYMRSLANRGYGYIGDYKVYVVGVISMDLIALDVTAVPDHLLHPGAKIELLGPRVLFNDVLDATSSTGYEMLTRLGIRVKRTYLA